MRHFALLFLASCASDTSKLEARVHELEREVADLRGRVSAERRTDLIASEPPCVPKNDSIAAGTQFSSPVAFDLGRTDLRSGDSITIREVLGTRPDFAVDGVYLVRGDYVLASADEASLGFSVTGGCTQGNTRGQQSVKKGSGKFELATKIVYVGQPHVTFYVSGQGSGGVYFGKGDFLYK